MFVNLFIINTFDDSWDTELNKRREEFSLYYDFQKFNHLICYLLNNFYHGLYHFGDAKYKDCVKKLLDDLEGKFALENEKYKEHLKDKKMLFSYSVMNNNDKLLNEYVNYCNNEINYLFTSEFSFKKIDELINDKLKDKKSSQYKKVKEIQDKIFSLISE